MLGSGEYIITARDNQVCVVKCVVVGRQCWTLSRLKLFSFLVDFAPTSYRGRLEALSVEKVFNLKLIPEFNGSSQSVAEWPEMLELVYELSGITDVAHVIPLRPIRRIQTAHNKEAPCWCVAKCLLGKVATIDLSSRRCIRKSLGMRIEDLSPSQLLRRSWEKTTVCERDTSVTGGAPNVLKTSVSKIVTASTILQAVHAELTVFTTLKRARAVFQDFEWAEADTLFPDEIAVFNELNAKAEANVTDRRPLDRRWTLRKDLAKDESSQ
uniref:Tudor domain-containing protein n=1 Tax=Trichuris muris TaxID=70415 RepID=A0A5S6QZM8_TRIMR